MEIETDRRIQVLSDLLHTKGWQQVLPDLAIELLTAVLDDGSHARDAIDARLRRSLHSRAGLAAPVSFPGSLSEQHSFAELLDLMTASGLLVVDHRGEYDINENAPRVIDSTSSPLLKFLRADTWHASI